MAIKATAQATIIDITDGYSAQLTSDTYNWTGSQSGIGANSTCVTEAYGWQGSNRIQNVTVAQADIVCPTGITATVENNKTSQVKITFKTTQTISTTCEATIPIVLDGEVTMNKKFTFSVSKQGPTGATGKGIKGTPTTEYAGSSSNTSIPTSGWSTTIPSVSAGQFLWTRVTTTYTDNTTSVSYSVAKQGSTGATGNGISKTTITYAASSSNTSAPGSGWQSTPPSVSAGQYLWTKTVFTYTNGTNSDPQYSVAKQGATGAAGADAISGAITFSNGYIFKNNTGSTVMTAHIWKGSVEQTISDAGVVENNLGSIKWYKTGSATAIATSKTLTVSADDIENTGSYYFQLEG